MKALMLLLLLQAVPCCPSEVKIIGGDRTVSFAVTPTQDRPGTVALEADVDWHGGRQPQLVWDVKGPSGSVITPPREAKANLRVPALGRYVIQVIVSDGLEIRNDSITVTVVEKK